MAQKKDLLAKVFGTRLSNRLRGSNAKSQHGSQQKQRPHSDPEEPTLRRPSTAPSRDDPRKSSYKRNPPPPILISTDSEEVEGLAIHTESDQEANSEGGRRRRRRNNNNRQRNDNPPERPRTAPNGSSCRITISPPPPMPDMSRRLSRRTSLRQRFWSANPSNQFGNEADNNDNDMDDRHESYAVPGSAAASRARSVYMPRHAASDFSKTAVARRKSVHARASERIARRFSNSEDNDDDAKTLCSINCREEQDPEQSTRDLDLWLATLRRQQAAMKTGSVGACSSSTGGCDADNSSEKHILQSQPSQKFLQCPPSNAPRSPLSPHGTFTSCTTGTSSASNYSHAAATESDQSDDEYGVFSQLQAESRNKAKTKAQARAAVRCSAIITTAPPLLADDADAAAAAATSPMPQDPILHRASTYIKGPIPLPPSPSPSATTARRSPSASRPKSLTASRSPRFSTFNGGARPPVPVITPGANTGPIMTDYLEPSRPRSSIARNPSDVRRTSCAKSPAVTTVVEAS